MLVFSEYQTDTIDLALDFMATKIAQRITNSDLASATILFYILSPREKASFTSIKKKST